MTSTILSIADARREYLDQSDQSTPSGADHAAATRAHFRSMECFGRYDDLTDAMAAFKATTVDEAVCQLAVLADMAERALSCGCAERSTCGCRPKDADDRVTRLAFSIYGVLKPLCETDVAPLVRGHFYETRNPWLDPLEQARAQQAKRAQGKSKPE